MERKFLPISTLSLLGTCETKFVESITEKLKPTSAMKQGSKKHEALASALPKIDINEVINTIKSGKQIHVRELSVFDGKLKLAGRIDQLDATGIMKNGRNSSVVIDDKFTKIQYQQIPLYYKLQLAAYAKSMENSDRFADICSIDKVKLICRDRLSGEVKNVMEETGDTLTTWKDNVDTASKLGWDLYKKEKAPEHRRFDVGSGNWAGCYCSQGSNNTMFSSWRDSQAKL
jgi:hypothetical protein